MKCFPTSSLKSTDPRFLATEVRFPQFQGLGPPGSPYTCCPNFRVTLGKPTELEEMLVKHPKLRVYLMRAGYPYINETIAILYMYRQVYVDVAGINWVLPREEFHNYLRALVRAGMEKRIMFGSDQVVWPEAISMAVEGVGSAEFLRKSRNKTSSTTTRCDSSDGSNTAPVKICSDRERGDRSGCVCCDRRDCRQKRVW